MSFGGGGYYRPAQTMDTTEINEKAREAAIKEAERMRKRRGLMSTILTGPQGILDSQQGMKQALGE